MPRKEPRVVTERPVYLDANGQIDFNKVFKLQTKQTELLRNVTRNGGFYVEPAAKQCLSVGGVRSGKTTGWLMFFVQHYCMKFKGCDILVLRRTFKELEGGAIKDFKTFVPKELYTYDSTKHVATFTNGSHVVFGHCNNLKDRDIEQYLGQAYPAILVDECGQFSADAWQMLFSRNLANAGCQPDEFNNLPKSVIVGCTNPIGPHYEYYRTLFVQKEPWITDEDVRDKVRKDETNGTWWAYEAGEWTLLYDPANYACQRSTVLDNPELLKREPEYVSHLMLLPKAKRDKMLLGLDGRFEGQYFDVFDPTYHVINLREDPDAIIWQLYQPVWIGQDWGMSHANSVHFFTKALVKKSVGDDYVLKTVCFAEKVVTGGKTAQELASIIQQMAKLPNGTPVTIKSIYFSHEKFSRQVTQHSPADEYSRALRAVGLPPATRATTDRIGSASFMYNMLKRGELVFLDTCRDIILSIPSLMRDPDLMDDVLKVDSRGDDCYDSCRYGLYGQLSTKKRPEIDAINEHAKRLDPLAAHFYRMKMMNDAAQRTVTFVQNKQPYWMTKQ
jgi:hypothetical protein